MVHPSAREDALTVARHRVFIGPRLLGCIAALASFPLYLIARGVPSVVELLVFGWLVAPILTAYFLSRTGRYECACLLSSISLTGLVILVAAATGGIGSFAAMWLVLVPIEASLSASRQVVVAAAALALGAAAVLALLGANYVLPARTDRADALTTLSIVTAALYATGLGLGAESLARTSLGLRGVEQTRYDLLARNVTDVITHHATDGGVLFASFAAESLFGAPVRNLHGQGLFERVHVADRPAYLTALGDSAALVESRTVELRVRRDEVIDGGGRRPHYLWIEMHCRPLERAGPAAAQDNRREVVAVMRAASECKGYGQSPEDAHAAERGDAQLFAITRAAAAADVQCANLPLVAEPVPMRSDERAVRKRA